jgi:hypothetical protein
MKVNSIVTALDSENDDYVDDDKCCKLYELALPRSIRIHDGQLFPTVTRLPL